MTEIDFDRLGDVWREQPDPAEMARLQRTAAEVARRARFAYIVDNGAAIAVAVVVVLLVLTNPSLPTVLMGSAAILVMLGSNIRQRQLRRLELKGLAGGTEDMLDQSIARTAMTLKRTRLSLVAFGPAILIGVLFAATSQGTSGSLLDSFRSQPTLRLLLSGVAVAVILGIFLFLILAIRRGRRELERLSAMRESYRRERESTAS